ncbi:hypothetical protein [Streptomyces sp. NBRC 109706]|uniref:hypothetical protein n=1 Tax=Streptomyces sp. NBRC 109706 TaxID=1550035 RepID=UPI000784F56E|nr:hypothetical protein [Streptomyces sp. NBRC 109706]
MAVEQLELPSPVIHMSPSEDAYQMVRVPTWLWIGSEGWGAVEETASVPGVSVTAVARPVRVRWSLGDGSVVVCSGPGTPFSADFSPGDESPDCGYTYTRSSLAEPGGVFTVSAELEWDVVWEGAGESGRVPGLRTSWEVPVTVDEIQALVVDQPSR